MKIALYTALFGSNSDLGSIDPDQYEGIDFYAFLDREHPTTQGWRQVVCPDFTFEKKYTGRRNAKPYKMLPHLFMPDYDYYVWMDSCHKLLKHPKDIIENYLADDFDLGLFDHPSDKYCAYLEAQTVLEYGIDNPQYIADQIQFYQEEGFPRKYCLYEMACFFRKNNPVTQKFGFMWYEQVCRFSSRDQISLPYVLWRMKEEVNISILPGYLQKPDGNEFFLFGQQPQFIKKY